MATISTQMQNDWDNYWQNGAGILNWAGGTLAKQDNGTALFTDANGNQQYLAPNQDMTALAQGNSAIANQWANQYGFDPNASTPTAPAATSGAQWGGTPTITSATIENYHPQTGGPSLPVSSTGTTPAIGTSSGGASWGGTSTTGANGGHSTGYSGGGTAGPSGQTGVTPSTGNWINTGYGPVSVPTATQLGTPGAINFTSATAAPGVSVGTGTASQASGVLAQAAGNIYATPAQAYASNGGAATYTAQQGNATNWVVNPNQTVQENIKEIIDKNSPLMQQAAAIANAKSNARGLLNSNLAVESAHNAVLSAATPIAQQDAATRAQAAQTNAGAANSMTQFNVNSVNSQGQFNAAAQNDMTSMNAQLATQVSLANADNLMKAGIVNQEQANAMAKFNAELLTNVNLSNVKSQNDLQQFLLDQQLKAGIVNQQQANAIAQFNASEANKTAQTWFAGNIDVAKANMEQINSMAKAGLDAQNKVALANIQASYNVLMQTSSSAASLYQQYVGNISQILQNQDMDSNAKTQAITGLVTQLNNGMSIIGQIANMNLPSLVFNSPTPGGGASNSSTSTSTNPSNSGSQNSQGGGNDGNGGTSGNGGGGYWT